MQELRLMGESDSTVSQPPKPVCDWSLGPVGGEVKAHFPEFFSTAQTLRGKPFTSIPVFLSQWKTWSDPSESTLRNGATI
jgi:hypothetical protein